MKWNWACVFDRKSTFCSHRKWYCADNHCLTQILHLATPSNPHHLAHTHKHARTLSSAPHSQTHHTVTQHHCHSYLSVRSGVWEFNWQSVSVCVNYFARTYNLLLYGSVSSLWDKKTSTLNLNPSLSRWRALYKVGFRLGFVVKH